MVSARYRAPTSVPEPGSPMFRAWLLGQLREIAQDGAALGITDPPTSISLERIEVPAGAQRRVQPTASGMVAVLEAPSSSNAGLAVTFFIENPSGALTIVASPHVAADGKVTATLINGQRRATYTLPGVVQLFSNGQDSWRTAAESPDETELLPGRRGPTGPTGPSGTSGSSSALRRIRRQVYYADGTMDTIENGATVNTASTTFGLQTDGRRYVVWLCAGGTGGSRGYRQGSPASDATGAGAPGGGAVARWEYDREDIEAHIAALGADIPVTVGAGGAGAPAVAAGSGNQAGAAGTLGGVTTFGALLAAHPGGLGAAVAGAGAGTIPGAGGGGWLSAGQNSGSGDELGGAPTAGTGTSTADGTYGGGKADQGLISGDDQGAGSSIWGGGGGGGNRTNGAGDGRGGGRSLFGVPGAGPGGSLDSTGPVARAGGAAGLRGAPASGQAPTRPVGGGPAGGAAGSGAVSGGDGGDGADGILGLYPGESGGGGGGWNMTAGTTGTSGRGGDGGFPGGSGGCSGNCFAGAGGGGTGNAARGGDGEDGVAVVDTLG